jgi:hypothetical protein
MALRHKELPVVGVQFHPESILTEYGYELLTGFLRLAGLAVPAAQSLRNVELAPVVPQPMPMATRPVAFTPPSAV